MHEEPHPMAGKTVKLKNGEDFRVEDWWDRLGQGGWKDGLNKNIACINYFLHCKHANLPEDDECVYGKLGSYGYLFHVSELDL